MVFVAAENGSVEVPDRGVGGFISSQDGNLQC